MKACIIGMGRMGRRHIKILRYLGLDLVGVFDIKKESIDLAIVEENVPYNNIFNSAEEMLKKTKPDLAIVATTAPSHCYYTKMIANEKVPYILCEKPMATSLEECDEMINICKKNNCKLGINHQMMFMEQYTKVKELINEDNFGFLSSINISAGNFGFAMNGTHYFEMFRYLTDEEPYEVTAWFSNEIVPNPRGVEFEDNGGQIMVKTKSGKRLYMDIGTDQGHWIIVVYAGRNGLIVADGLNGKLFYYCRKKEYKELPTTRYAMPSEFKTIEVKPADIIEPTANLLKAMFENKTYTTGEKGKLAISVLVAAYKSNENGNLCVRIKDLGDYYVKNFPWA